MRPTRSHLVSPVALLAAVAVWLTACASAPEMPTLYLLRGEPLDDAVETRGQTVIGLGRIVVAPYLLQSPGLVLETAPGVVRAAQLHQWAEPMDEGIRWFLRTETSRSLGDELVGAFTDRADWDYSVDVFIGRLHGTMQGEALLEAGFQIRTADGRQYATQQFVRRERLTDSGYAALADAEKKLLQALAWRIADELGKVRTGAAPELRGAGSRTTGAAPTAP